MKKSLAFAAAAALAFAAGSAMAQSPTATQAVTDAVSEQPPGTTPATPATPAEPGETSATPATPATPPGSDDPAGPPSASATGADVSVTAGMDVRDKTGAKIGKVTDVKAGADGKQTATIQMGADSFAVDTASLAVAEGAATVNASEDEIKQMLKR